MTSEYTAELYGEDVSMNDAGPELVVEDIERKDFVKYAGASGDFNPIHYDEPYAKEAGNQSVFGQGMCTAGYAAHMVSDWFGVENIRTFRVRFRARVWPGDTVTVSGEVTDVTQENDYATVKADIVTENDTGDTLVTGTVIAELPFRD